MPKKKATARRAREHRPSWKGNLQFGLVSFAVEAINAVDRERSDIHFHQLHAPCHSRIRYEKVCPIHGPVGHDEIVSGYEYAKGKYVEIDDGELDALRPDSERSLTIDAFVASDAIDPLYFDGRMYYLLPAEKSAAEAYGVFGAAMAQEERCGVGRVLFSGKIHPAVVRPIGGVLHMALLNYAAEIRPPQKMASGLAKPASASRQLKLAESLIRNWSDDKFDFSKYEDDHREQVQKLIDAKVKGRKIVAPKETVEEPATINLMDALKRSHGKPRAAASRRPRNAKRNTA